jgi:hypothetical protein
VVTQEDGVSRAQKEVRAAIAGLIGSKETPMMSRNLHQAVFVACPDELLRLAFAPYLTRTESTKVLAGPFRAAEPGTTPALLDWRRADGWCG